MIPFRLTIALIIAIIAFFILVLSLLKYRRLELKYTLLWLFTGMVMLILVIWPGLMMRLVSLVGIQSNMNGLFILLIAFIIIILMSLTSICSVQNAQIRRLIQSEALYEKRVRDVENTIKKLIDMQNTGQRIQDNEYNE